VGLGGAESAKAAAKWHSPPSYALFSSAYFAESSKEESQSHSNVCLFRISFRVRNQCFTTNSARLQKSFCAQVLTAKFGCVSPCHHLQNRVESGWCERRAHALPHDKHQINQKCTKKFKTLSLPFRSCAIVEDSNEEIFNERLPCAEMVRTTRCHSLLPPKRNSCVWVSRI
jgi:hypothetical protein